MRSIKFLINQIHRDWIDFFIVLKLRLNYSLGRYDNKTESLLNYFSKRWYLSKLSEDLFLNFLNEEIKCIEKRIRSYNRRLFSSTIVKVLFSFIPSAFICFLMFIIPFPFTRALLFIIFSFTLILGLILTVVKIERIPSEKKIIETERYFKILRVYASKSRPMAILNTTKVINEYKSIQLPFSNTELASFIYYLSNNKDTFGIINSHITYFIETNCIKEDGSLYNSLNSLISKCNPKSGELDSELLLKRFFNKLKQTKQS